MLIAGIIALVLAAVAVGLALVERSRRKAMEETETLSCAELERRRGANGSPAVFALRCEVVGRAAPASGEPLVAPFSKTPCVWYRNAVTHHYWKMERRRDSRTRRMESKRRERQKVVSTDRSPGPFLVDDGSGTIAIEPGERKLAAAKVHGRFEPDESAAQGSPELASLGNAVAGLIGASPPFGARGGSLGYEFEEWAIPVGQQLYVLGEASDRSGGLAIGEGDDGGLVVSTESEEKLVREAASTERWLYVGAGVLAVAGAVLVVLGVA